MATATEYNSDAAKIVDYTTDSGFEGGDGGGMSAVRGIFEDTVVREVLHIGYHSKEASVWYKKFQTHNLATYPFCPRGTTGVARGQEEIVTPGHAWPYKFITITGEHEQHQGTHRISRCWSGKSHGFVLCSISSHDTIPPVPSDTVPDEVDFWPRFGWRSPNFIKWRVKVKNICVTDWVVYTGITSSHHKP